MMVGQSSSNIRAYTVASMVAIGAMLLIVGYDLIVPKPKLKLNPIVHKRDVQIKQSDVTLAKRDLANVEANIARYVWTGSLDQISSTSLNAITAMAKRRGVTLLAFRPQKSTVDAGLIRIPYAVIVEGSYPAVISFVSDLENVQNKLAPELIQVASSDPSTDKVNATINVIAYTVAPKELTSASTKK